MTKASVTIVFNNSDRATSPVSFENYAQITVTRQVAMGGLSKYLINGHKATLQAVQNMFQSVQLNINNPNFLIMQGKITKVLNMKPVEILSMIEEAAGTRMFEDRKEKAIKTMTKKDQKVQEINALLMEEITPKLDKLREEKRSFLEYQKMSSELEKLTRIAKAWEWQQLRSKAQERGKACKDKSKQRAKEEKDAEEFKRQIGSIEKELEKLEKERERKLAKGSKMKGLLEQAKELSNELIKAKTSIDFHASAREEDEKRVVLGEKALQELKDARTAKTQEHDKTSSEFAKFKADHEAALEEISKDEELLQTLTTGMASKASAAGNQGGGYMGRLADARVREAAASSEVQQNRMRTIHLEKEVKAKEGSVAKATKEGASLAKQLADAKAQVDQLKAKLQASGYDADKTEALKQQRIMFQQQLDELSEKRDAIASKLTSLDFAYSDPEPDFDRSRVKGLIANLVELDADHSHYSTALEVCAGGRLYNVVVEEEKTGSQLLSKGHLRKRVTLIPLNKISAFVASAAKVGAAQKIAPGKVDLALSLIGYQDDVAKAMQYVFGNTLICADAATAKRVTFDAAVKLKSVTLEGDVYDPSGTLSGGSRPNSGGILVKAQQLNRVQKELDIVRRQLKDCETQLAAEEAKASKLAGVTRELQLKSHEVSLMEEQVENSAAARLHREIQEAKSTIESLRAATEDATARAKQAVEEVTFFEKEMQEFNQDKSSKLVELRQKVKQRKAALQTSVSEMKKRQNQVRTLALELENGVAEMEAAEKDLEKQRQIAKKAAAELESHKVKTAEMQVSLKSCYLVENHR